MGYDKGTISKEKIVQAAAGVVLAQGYAATSIADLSKAAHTSAGKLTHHFPTKMDLFEAVFEATTSLFKAGPLTLLGDKSHPPKRRIDDFFDAMYRLYAGLEDPIGCPVGHAAGDSEGVSASMRAKAFDYLKETEKLFEAAFLELGDTPSVARSKGIAFVNAWQGAVVMARGGGGIQHIDRVFRSLRSMTGLGLSHSEKPSKKPAAKSLRKQ